MARWSLSWGNPYTQPPGPRVLAAVLVERGQPCPAEVKALWSPGCGYVISWQLVTQRPIRRWSAEAKAKVRRRNLRDRLERKVPLFAEILIAEELERRPSYYAGGEEDARPLPGGRA
ncbi:hypothetical protein [Bosea minatitlanensis]|uniref:Theronine dehydrogenase n=1 Tax=Bosea minatitlanensis TaxID=128782 RepID=A0ABW0EYZ1_9HYPH|nr:hypothetical protein [Bosea minatitlanensis]MCT4496064.1 theronine dehydrogenase [Bosea minatitlanensis]